MKYLSLFSGIGGFELGITQAYEDTANQHGRPDIRERHSGDAQGRSKQELPTCVGLSEIDKYAVQIYQRHFPNHKNYGDITKIDTETLPHFDLLVGGFPCQAFSIAGKRKGFEDTRGTLFFDIARILRAKRPRLLLLENVKGLLSHDNGNTFKTIISTLDELGYDLQWQVLNSKDFGVPQNRERIFIVGHLRGEARPEIFPIGFNAEEVDDSCERRSSRGEVAQTITSSYHKGAKGSNIIAKTVRSGGRASPHGSKQNWDSYEFEGRIRRLTPLECERLQGFPDGWTEGVSDTQRYKTLGNAVTVNVIQAIAKRLLK